MTHSLILTRLCFERLIQENLKLPDGREVKFSSEMNFYHFMITYFSNESSEEKKALRILIERDDSFVTTFNHYDHYDNFQVEQKAETINDILYHLVHDQKSAYHYISDVGQLINKTSSKNELMKNCERHLELLESNLDKWKQKHKKPDA